MRHAIEERENHCFPPNGGRKGFDGAFEIVGLTAQEDEIEVLIEVAGKHKRRQFYAYVPEPAFDHEAGVSELVCAPLPDQECDVSSGMQKPCPEVAAYRTGADNQNAHVSTPTFLFRVRFTL
jgi:hypothetical protein